MDLGPPAGPPDPNLLYDSKQVPVQDRTEPYTQMAAKKLCSGQELVIVVSVGLSQRNPHTMAVDGNRYCRMWSAEAMPKGRQISCPSIR
jgi:hypothetical protein